MATDVNKLIEDNIGLLKWGYKNFYEKYPLQYRDEIYSIANYSLYKAATKYNSDKTTKFSTFYSKILINEINDYFRKQSAKCRKSEYGEDILLSTIVSDSDSIELENCLTTKEDYNPLQYIISKESISEFFDSLNEREMDVVKLKIHNPDITQKEIGEILGVSNAVISKRFKNIREKINKVA